MHTPKTRKKTGWMTASRSGAASAALLAVIAAVVLGITGLLLWSLFGSSGASGTAWQGGPGDESAAGGAAGADSVEASLRAAGVYLQREEFGKAEAVLTSAVGQFPEDIPLRLALAESLLQLGRSDEAYGQYEAALALEPNDADVQFQAGTLANTIGREDRALEHYSMARSQDPTDARFPLYLAWVQLAAGDRDEAKVNFLHALHLDPTSAAAAGALSRVALEENTAQLALNYAQTAREIDPDSLVYLVYEARALKRLGRPDEAVAMLLALPNEALHQEGVLQLASECFGLLRQPEAAAELWAEASASNPSDAGYAYQAAIWSDRAGDAAGALLLAKQAQMLGSEPARALVDRLGG